MTANLGSSSTLLTGGAQTMMTWAKVIRSGDAVPEGYRAAIRPLVEGRDEFPYIVLAPTMGGPRRKATESEKVLCDVGDTLHVLERSGNQVTTTAFPWKAARDIEFGNILLYAWITLSGRTPEGEAAASTVEFNLATARHFAPFIRKMRPGPTSPSTEADEARLRAEQAKFDDLAAVSYKFMNFACESLVPGETVVQSLWQPDLRRRAGAVLGWPIYRTVSLAHLSILTDKELILIWDDERSAVKAGTRYGGVWRYIPLRHIVSTSQAETEPAFVKLSLELTAGGRVDKVFAASSREAVAKFRQEIEKLLGR
jgi:hypothetical protein